jgi:hypothetical protein
MNMRAFIGVLALLAAGTSQAATVTIDFDALPVDYGKPFPAYDDSAFNEHGYSFYIENGGVKVDGAGKDLRAITYTSFDTGSVVIEQAGGGFFALHSVDAIFNNPTGASVSGRTSGGTNFSVTDLGSIGTGFWLSLEYVSFNAGAAELSTVFIDDVVVGSAVPVPAAVWLFGSALAGLGWMRRKQTV